MAAPFRIKLTGEQRRRMVEEYNRVRGGGRFPKGFLQDFLRRWAVSRECLYRLAKEGTK